MVRIAKQTGVLCLPYKGLLSSSSALPDISLVLSQEVGSVRGDPSDVEKESGENKVIRSSVCGTWRFLGV